MKRKIFVLFVLCSCISFLVKRTLGQEIAFTAGDNDEGNTTPTILVEEIDEDSSTLAIDKLRSVENDDVAISQKGKTVISEADLIVGMDRTAEVESLNETKLADTSINLGMTKSGDLLIAVEALDVKNIKVLPSIDSGNESQLDNAIGKGNVELKVALTEVETRSADNAEVSQSEVSLSEFESQSGKDIEVIESIDTYTKRKDTTATNEIIASEITTIIADETPTEIPTLAEDETEEPVEALTETDNDKSTTHATYITAPSACTKAGIFAKENDCRSYFICTPRTTISELEETEKICPTEQAFHRELLRCTRDLSPCADTFKCEMEGTFADPTDNSAYYWCVTSRLNVSSYYIFHVKCGSRQIYTPELGKCFVDMMNLQDLPLNYELYLSKSPDEECVREEVKLMQAEEKAKLKEAKLREKIRKKYEKELMKKVAKEAKEQAKLQGVTERDNFICTQEGNFAATAESFYDYFVCLSKKGKLHAVGMKCAESQGFSIAKGICTI